MNVSIERILLAAAFAALAAAPTFGAEKLQPPPAGAFDGAPPQYTEFTPQELTRGFLALAFGSDLRIGTRPKGIRRFTEPIRVNVVGNVAPATLYKKILAEFGEKIPNLHLSIVEDPASANVVVRLIDEHNFVGAMEAAFGRRTVRTFVKRTDPQCMTSLRSRAEGTAVRADVFIIVDKGEMIFLDCAYHETLHAFGLSNHDQLNEWTTLNQKRLVGYLSVYDRDLLTLLYDPRIRPGMSKVQVTRILPDVIQALPGDN